MFISTAYAAAASTVEGATGVDPATVAPSETQTLIMNMGMLLVLGVLFYLLMIRPQQKRFKEHSSMLQSLGSGTKIVTQGGLVGTIDKVLSDHEVQIDVGNGVKVTMMRSYIIGRYEDAIAPLSRPANDDKKSKKGKTAQ